VTNTLRKLAPTVEEEPMTLERSVVVPGVLAEYRSFGELLSGLSDEQWRSPTRCEGWSVGDVAGHVVGQLSDVTAFRLEGLGTPEVTARQVEERRGRGPAELGNEFEAAMKIADDLIAAFDDEAYDAAGPQGTGQTLGSGLESLWFDTFLHADDIRAALGQKTASTAAYAPSVSHIAQVLTDQGWHPASIRLDGLDEFVVGDGDPNRVIEGDPMRFILVSSGRADPEELGLDPSVNIYR
jgi:uncharacterized protein (TIGR03083 family)